MMINTGERSVKRRHLIYYLRVMDRDTEELLGFLVDITTKGFMVMSEKPIQTGKIFHLKILRATDSEEKQFLFFDARTKWSERSVNSEFYDTGFELVNVTPDDFEEIEKIIDELGFKD